jgi:hypothetical protein
MTDEEWVARNPFVLMCRSRYLHLNDPRCYNGCYFDAEYRWGQWEVLDRLPTQEKADSTITFWTELNDYAVSQRGEGAKSEFKIEVKEIACTLK